MNKTYRFNASYILTISFISAMGGYLFGFDFAVISGALPFLKTQLGLNEYWEGFATGSLALGAIAGCVVAGSIAEKYGRRPGLLLAAAIFAISSIAMAFSHNKEAFIAFRFIAGAGVGMASMLSPMYIAEISPAHMRGRMVAINQLTVVLGILITNFVNYSLRGEGTDAWRWMFGLGAVPSAIFLIGVLFLPESPRWLVSAGKISKAEKILNKIGDDNFTKDSLNTIQQSLKNSAKPNVRLAFSKMFLPALIIGIGLAVLQQFCGINVVFNYAPKIYESVGASLDKQLLETVLIGGVNLTFTLLAMALVDKIGRKPLMLIGTAGLAILFIFIAQLLSTSSGNVSWFLLASIATYAMSLAPITWVLIAEIFPNQIRGIATSIAVIFLWLAYFILVSTFPPLFKLYSYNTFYAYAIICALGFVFVWIKVKETKGKTLEEMNGPAH